MLTMPTLMHLERDGVNRFTLSRFGIISCCMRWLAKKMYSVALRVAAERDPDFVVQYDSRVYLRRWWLVPRNPILNVYLHNMVGDDADALHDHKYLSLSLMLDGRMIEQYQRWPPISEVWSDVLRPGRWRLRSPWMAHRLIVVKPSWTLFITGPYVKGWGFWCDDKKLDYREYSRGSGCGQ
jgi:hypothetical protein